MVGAYIGGQYKPLSQDRIGRLHETALRILEEVGVKVELAEALAIFRKAGAEIDAQTARAKIPPKLVEKALSTAPSAITLCGRDPEHDLLLEGSRVHMGTGGSAVRVIDPDTEKTRASRLDDIAKLAALVDGLENVHFFVRPCAAQDVPKEDLAVNEFYASLSHTTKHVMAAGYTLDGTRKVTLAQLHAEELSGLTFVQLVKPGAPVLYGGIPSMADMHDLSYKAGGVEFGLMNAAISQLAAYIGVPNYCSAGITEARIPGMQAIYEKTFSICQVALAGGNYIHHASGVLESIMTVDYGQFVIDNEIIGMALKMLKGIGVDEDRIAFDEIRSVGGASCAEGRLPMEPPLVSRMIAMIPS